MRLGFFCALPLVLLALSAFAEGAGSAATQPAPNSVNGSNGKSLSRQLSETGGVITPKRDVDPGMDAPAPVPQPNSTPVIPPSATGGNTAK